MREVFSETVSSDRVTISINEGTFDATGIEDQWGDLVVIAQVDCMLPSIIMQRLMHGIPGISLVSRI